MKNSFENWSRLNEALKKLCLFLGKKYNNSFMSTNPTLAITDEGSALMREVEAKLNLKITTTYFSQWKQYHTHIYHPSTPYTLMRSAADSMPEISLLFALAKAAELYQHGEPTVETVGNYTYYTPAKEATNI